MIDKLFRMEPYLYENLYFREDDDDEDEDEESARVRRSAEFNATTNEKQGKVMKFLLKFEMELKKIYLD